MPGKDGTADVLGSLRNLFERIQNRRSNSWPRIEQDCRAMLVGSQGLRCEQDIEHLVHTALRKDAPALSLETARLILMLDQRPTRTISSG